MRKIFLLRHGKPEFPGGKKRCIGRTDLPLSKEGRQQAAGWRERKDLAGVTKIYSSPMKRCQESAALFSDGRIPIQTLPDCAEISMGLWENKTFDEIRQEYPEEYRERGEHLAEFVPPGGESFRACQRRAAAAYRKILAESEGDVAIVAHAGWNRALLSFLTGRDLNHLLEIPQEYGEICEIPVPKGLGAVIVAAGLSSRMGAWKPALKIGERSFLEWELDCLLRAGVSRTVIVTGKRGDEIERAYEGPGIECVKNERYAETKMFDSACLGFRRFDSAWKGIFFLPGDSPMFSVYTVKRLWEALEQDGEGETFCPFYRGKPGHPLLLRGRVLPRVLAHDGRMGLRGACEGLGEKQRKISVPDPGILLDADEPREYQELLTYAKSLKAPDEAWCREWMEELCLPEHLRAHLFQTAQTAKRMAEAVNEAGGHLDVELVEAAARLHDVAKGRKAHGSVAASWLRDLGYIQVAELVEGHECLPASWKGAVDERLIVYLADKLVQGDQNCTIDERYQSRLAQFSGDAAAEEAIRTRWQEAKLAEQAYLTVLKNRAEICNNLDTI
ncbi:DVU_1551 family NTP transferase [Hominifimenecus sp. rT4P-3]|uniref:DVU_1551 family NTP transferase n=1 Tax=Hominifimenecus sp. rT4P-3 TaxID=3242979 RepID=UPI003DA6BD3D